MSTDATEVQQIVVNDVVVDVERKDIKNLYLAVHPPTGRVRIAAPLRVNDEAVRLFAISKISWIRRQQAKFEGQERQSEREFVSGESHYYLGKRYLLNVIYQEGVGRVVIRNNRIMDLYVPTESDRETRERILLKWYRKQLKQLLGELIPRWESTIGVKVNAWGVKWMKTKWGTCNVNAGRVWLNLELIKKPMHCLEYVVVHELVHLLERHHNESFTAAMTVHMPHWKLYRAELGQTPLGHAVWENSL